MKIRLNQWRHCRGCIGGSSKSETDQPVTTTSGSATAQTGTNSTSAQPGSIALGVNSKYQESGSVDLSGASGSGVGQDVGAIDAGGGSTINIVPQAALDAFTSAISSVAAGSGGGASSTPVVLSTPANAGSASGNISYKTMGLIIAAIAAIAGLIALFRKAKKS